MNHSSIRKALSLRDEQVYCRHTTDSLAKNTVLIVSLGTLLAAVMLQIQIICSTFVLVAYKKIIILIAFVHQGDIQRVIQCDLSFSACCAACPKDI